MAGNHTLGIPEETYVVALLARGDRIIDIQAEFEKTFERTINKATVVNIRKRNAENLEIIRSRTQEKIERDQAAIRNKANAKIDKKLDSDDLAAQVIAKAHSQYINGEIDYSQYSVLLRSVKELSVSELVSVSKEMHLQASDAPGEPVNNEDMQKLQAAIQAGDTLTLNQLVFKRGQPSEDSGQPVQPVQTSGQQSPQT